MNPMAALKLRPLIEAFRENHPKIPAFISAVSSTVDIGSVVEMKVTSSDGKELISNIRVTEQDIQLLNELRTLLSNE